MGGASHVDSIGEGSDESPIDSIDEGSDESPIDSIDEGSDESTSDWFGENAEPSSIGKSVVVSEHPVILSKIKQSDI